MPSAKNIPLTNDSLNNFGSPLFIENDLEPPWIQLGEELVNEELKQFIGEYTKQINLSDNAKGIYFLEIETNEGVINKKLILH